MERSRVQGPGVRQEYRVAAPCSPAFPLPFPNCCRLCLQHLHHLSSLPHSMGTAVTWGFGGRAGLPHKQTAGGSPGPGGDGAGPSPGLRSWGGACGWTGSIPSTRRVPCPPTAVPIPPKAPVCTHPLTQAPAASSTDHTSFLSSSVFREFQINTWV